MCAFHQAERHAAATFAEATRRPNAVATWILEHGAAFHASWIAAHQEDADVPRSV
jgi:hypothetical protein